MTPTPEVVTRPATAADTEFARAAHHAAYRGVVERQFGPWDEAAQDGYFTDDWNPAATEVVLVGGAPAGYWVVEERGEDVHVREFVLHPSWQGVEWAPHSSGRRSAGRRRAGCRFGSGPSRLVLRRSCRADDETSGARASRRRAVRHRV